ncbi:peptidase S41 [Dyella mobilis]|nr:peptidase S41 [Dyella mobilis]
MWGGLLFAFHFNFHRAAPDANYPKPASPLEAQQQDVDYFAKVMARDRAFSPAERKTAEARIAVLRALPNALPSPALHVALMQVMALADNGHSRMDATAERGALIVPLRVTRFAEGFYVTRVEAAYRDMLGGRVESIDGHPIDQVLLQLDTLRGGVESFRRENDAIFIIVQNLLYGLGIATDPKASTWTVVLPDGRTVTRRLDAYSMHEGDRLPGSGRWLSPEPNKGVEQDWGAYHPQSAELPETWRDFNHPFRMFPAAGGCAQVVRLQSIGDAGSYRIAPFLASTEATLRASPPCAVILDLRGDGGGDYTNVWHFTHVLPTLLAPGGRIFVLTNSQTFSAAITAAAFVKDAGGDKVTIIGEPVGDRLSFFSEGSKACLPNLKVCVYAQTAKHDYQHPCDNWRECYWLNWFYPVRVKSLQPDIVVPLRFEDWNRGRDAAYETARQLAITSQQKRP